LVSFNKKNLATLPYMYGISITYYLSADEKTVVFDPDKLSHEIKLDP
jgi:hypothetical protein